jgi:Rrf2 family protein
MFLTTRGRYATRAMLRLAMEGNGRPVPVAEVADKEQISEKYLQQLLGTLKRAGLVRVVMGPHGGFELARDPDEISIGAILRAVEGDIALVECLVHEAACDKIATCVARCVWAKGTDTLNTFFDSATLGKLLKEHPPCKARSASGRRRPAAVPGERGRRARARPSA